jgi:acetyl-CoA C-acetyltransferase
MAPAIDPRLPVLIGAGQHNQRVDRGDPALEPTDLMAIALGNASASAGTPDDTQVLAGADTVGVVSVLSWRYRDPGALVAAQVGARPRRTIYTSAGGNSPQALVNLMAREIQDGRADLVLLCGAEAWRTRMAARQIDQRPKWTVQPDDVAPSETFGHDEAMSHPAEQARGIFMPVQVYPMFENALRASAGRSIADHTSLIAGLWARFSEVAASNPNAWIQEAFTAAEIAAPTPDNRMIGFPYTKRMNSNNAVEQSAAVIMCSVERARSLGVPSDRWVFPLAGSDAHDTSFVSNRRDFRSSPAIQAAGAAALRLAGTGVDDVSHVDLYSCFPSAVQIAAAELGLGLDRPLTITGGLSFAGGPWNNYVMHSIATMVDRLREDAGSVGLITANGGFVTKHAFGVYSTTPPRATGRFEWTSPQAEVDAITPREVVEDWEGLVTVETGTVMHSREGEPENGFLALLLDDGRRAWGTTQDPDALKLMMTDELVGKPAHLGPAGSVTFV